MTNTALPLFTPDASVPITDPHHITASPVADEYRINFWPQHFGGIPQWLMLEPRIFAWMDRLCADYHGGIDGIELADLINAVCDNGYSLRVADESGKRVTEDPLPSAARLNGIQCSTAHITEADNTLLFTLSHQYEDFGDCEWIMYTGSGYLLYLGAWSFPVLRLKRLGLSKACRHLVVTLMHRYSAGIIHLDAFGELLPGFATFDW